MPSPDTWRRECAASQRRSEQRRYAIESPCWRIGKTMLLALASAAVAGIVAGVVVEWLS